MPFSHISPMRSLFPPAAFDSAYRFSLNIFLVAFFGFAIGGTKPLHSQSKLYGESGTLLLQDGTQVQGKFLIEPKPTTYIRQEESERTYPLPEIRRLQFEDGRTYLVQSYQGSPMLFSVLVEGTVSLLSSFEHKAHKPDQLWFLKGNSLVRIPKESYKQAIQENLTACDTVTNAYYLQKVRYTKEDLQSVVHRYNQCVSGQATSLFPIPAFFSKWSMVVGGTRTDINRIGTRYFNSTYQKPDLGLLIGIQHDQGISHRVSLIKELAYRYERVRIVDAPLLNGNLLQGKLSYHKFQIGAYMNLLLKESERWKTYAFLGPQINTISFGSYSQEVAIIPPNTENRTVLIPPLTRLLEIGGVVGAGVRKKFPSGRQIGLEVRWNQHYTIYGPEAESLAHKLLDLSLVIGL